MGGGTPALPASVSRVVDLRVLQSTGWRVAEARPNLFAADAKCKVV
jgi:hypothetical protein